MIVCLHYRLAMFLLVFLILDSITADLQVLVIVMVQSYTKLLSPFSLTQIGLSHIESLFFSVNIIDLTS